MCVCMCLCVYVFVCVCVCCCVCVSEIGKKRDVLDALLEDKVRERESVC